MTTCLNKVDSVIPWTCAILDFRSILGYKNAVQIKDADVKHYKPPLFVWASNL
jgi:hypothetical protein